MAKRTKFSKFRDLYEVIEELAVSYTYEGVVEILAERHDLILTTGTLTNYLYRYRKESKDLSAGTDNFGSKNKNSVERTKVDKLAEDQNTITNTENPEPPKPKMNADEALARFKERQQNRSLFDRK